MPNPEIRAHARSNRAMLVALSDGARRNDRRFDDLEYPIRGSSGEPEPMPKAELMGRLMHFEVQIAERLARSSDRIDAV